MSESEPAVRTSKLALVLAIYLLGIFMGAIDTGIVAPARVVIQNAFEVAEQTGIWIITAYSLAYAASIPVMGKLADRIGRKRVYLVAICLFGLGSALCGLSEHFGGFGLLVVARVIQAIGGGGILPLATAEFGTEVPVNRRGLALGLVGGVYGLANIFGSSAGSMILDIVGVENWQWIFYVNVPISLLIAAAGLAFLPKRPGKATTATDLAGIALLVAMIASLLYGLGNLDVFDLTGSLTSATVWPYLLAGVVLLPLFVVTERRAADPVMNLAYFKTPAIAATLAIGFATGIIMMGMVFVPQFAENAMGQPAGKGGYWVILLGVASGVGAPLSGRLTDRFGPRKVLAFGFAMTIVSVGMLVAWAIPSPSFVSVGTALATMGFGLGFVIGSPLNFMMLANTAPQESNSALASLSLVRAVGITIAPAIMVGFLAHAGAGMQTALLEQLPAQVPAPVMPYAADLDARFERLQADPALKEKLAGVSLPRLSEQKAISIDMSSGAGLSDELVELLRTADVTTITRRTKTVATAMFDANTPARVADIQRGVQQGVDALDSAVAQLRDAGSQMDTGITGMTDAISGMATGISEMTDGIDAMGEAVAGLTEGIDAMGEAVAGMGQAIAEMDSGLAGMDQGLAGMQTGIDEQGSALTEMQAGIRSQQTGLDGIDAALTGQRAALAQTTQLRAMFAPGSPTAAPPGSSLLDLVPAPQRAQLPAAATAQLATMTSVADLDAAIQSLRTTVGELEAKRAALADAQTQLRQGAGQLAGTRAALTAQRSDLQRQRVTLAAARGDLAAKRAALATKRGALVQQRATLTAQRDDLIRARADLMVKRDEVSASKEELTSARTEVAAAQADLIETERELVVLRDAVPGAFQEAERAYLDQVDERGPLLEATFRSELNEGFLDIYVTVALTCALAMGLLLFYPARRRAGAAGVGPTS